MPARIFFTGDVSNAWEDPRNWTDDQLPGRTDTAVIDSFDVIVSAGSAAAIEVSNGSLTVNGTLGGEFSSTPIPSYIGPNATVTLTNPGSAFVIQQVAVQSGGRFIWGAGSVNSGFTNEAGGVMTLASDDPMSDAIAIINYGLIRHTGAGRLQKPVINQAGGVYDLQTDADIQTNPFTNYGILRKSGGAGTSEFIGSVLTNEGGTVDVQTGTLVLGGFQTTLTSTGGHFIVASGAVLQLPHGTYAGNHTGEGAGLVRLAIDRGVMASIGTGGATFNLPPGLLEWTTGSIRLTSGPLNNDGTLRLAGPDLKTLRGDQGYPMVNNGTIIHTDGGMLNFFALLNNRGLYQLESDAGIVLNTAGVIQNTGVFQKTGGAGTSSVEVVFDNAVNAQVNIQSGNMRMLQQTNAGAVTIAAGSTLEFGTVTGYGYASFFTQTAAGTLNLQLNRDVWGKVQAGASTFDVGINLDGILVLTETAPVNGTFVIIDNDGTDPVNGTFAGLPQESIIVTPRGTRYQISYRGGTGNDVTLTNVSPPNSPPTADAGGPYVIAEGESLTLDASASFDPDGDSLSYSWDIDGRVIDASDETLTLSWADLNALGIDDGSATHNVRLRLHDGVNAPVPSAPTSLSILDRPPTMLLSGDDHVDEGSSYTLALGPIIDPGADVLSSITIDWGDGSLEDFAGAVPATINHVYRDSDAWPTWRTIRAHLTDEDGTHLDAGVLTVAVQPVIPVLNIGGDVILYEGDLVLSRLCSFADPGDDTWTAMVQYDERLGLEPLILNPDKTFNLFHIYDESFRNGTTFTVTVYIADEESSAATGFFVTLLDVLPTLEVGDDETLFQGETLSRIGHFTDPGSDLVGTVDYGQGAGAEPLTLNPDGTLQLSDTYNEIGKFFVQVTVMDYAGLASAGFVVTVLEADAPVADAGGPYVIEEGDALQLVAAPSSSVPGRTLTYSWDIDADRDGVFEADELGVATGRTPVLSRARLHDLGLDDGPATFQVRVQVSDGVQPPALSPETTLTALNVAPQTDISGPDQGVRGQPLRFLIRAKDGSLTDEEQGFGYRIGWGDDSDVEVIDPTPNNGLGIWVEHIYEDVGDYEIKLEALDESGIGGNRRTVTIAAWALQPDPCDPSQTAFVVGGTTDFDTIRFRSTRFGQIQVSLNDDLLGAIPRTFVSRVIAYGQDGDDTISSNLDLPGLFDGGKGDDELVGGVGPDVLVGGPGDDTLLGDGAPMRTGGSVTQGDNVLIGGLGEDTLAGGSQPSDDLLIAGFTTFDTNAAALCAILDEWSSQRDYEFRVQNLRGTPNPEFEHRHNRDFYLVVQGTGQTVFDDGAADHLNGRGGRDWFFVNPTDTSFADILQGLHADEEMDAFIQDTDVGDTRRSATELAVRDWDVIDFPTDVDWYVVTNDGVNHPSSRFEVSAPQSISLTIAVYDQAGNLLAATTVPAGGTSSVTFSTSRRYSYYLKVSLSGPYSPSAVDDKYVVIFIP